MISRVSFRPAAEADLQHAYDWYEERRPSLGVEFMREVDRCISNIISQPEMYPVVHHNVRQAPIRRFPHLRDVFARRGSYCRPRRLSGRA